MGCEAWMSPSLKGSTFFYFFMTGEGGCSCSIVIIS